MTMVLVFRRSPIASRTHVFPWPPVAASNVFQPRLTAPRFPATPTDPRQTDVDTRSGFALVAHRVAGCADECCCGAIAHCTLMASAYAAA